MDDFPNQPQIYAFVVMNNSVAQTVDVSPGDEGMGICKGVVNLVRQLPHLTEIEHTGLHQFGIGAKFRVTHIFTVI